MKSSSLVCYNTGQWSWWYLYLVLFSEQGLCQNPSQSRCPPTKFLSTSQYFNVYGWKWIVRNLVMFIFTTFVWGLLLKKIHVHFFLKPIPVFFLQIRLLRFCSKHVSAFCPKQPFDSFVQCFVNNSSFWDFVQKLMLSNHPLTFGVFHAFVFTAV